MYENWIQLENFDFRDEFDCVIEGLLNHTCIFMHVPGQMQHARLINEKIGAEKFYQKISFHKL